MLFVIIAALAVDLTILKNTNMDFRFGLLLLFGTCMSLTSALAPCVCTRDRRPVCGSDGRTYSNKCLLECAALQNPDLTMTKRGQCESNNIDNGCICTLEYAPVCGTDGKSYPNRCALRCQRSSPDVDVAYPGECRVKREEVQVAQLPLPKCTCTREKFSVCGTDGNTYSNPCMLACAKKNNDDLELDHVGPCDNKVKVAEYAVNNPSCACTRNLRPVCASNGVTYNNPCLMKCAGAHLTIEKQGSCDA